MLRELMEYEEEQFRREMAELDALIDAIRLRDADVMCCTRLSLSMAFETSLRMATRS